MGERLVWELRGPRLQRCHSAEGDRWTAESLLTVEPQQEQRQAGGRPEDTAADPTATLTLAGHPGLGQPTLSHSCQENRSERADPGRMTLRPPCWLHRGSGRELADSTLPFLDLSLPRGAGHPTCL